MGREPRKKEGGKENEKLFMVWERGETDVFCSFQKRKDRGRPWREGAVLGSCQGNCPVSELRPANGRDRGKMVPRNEEGCTVEVQRFEKSKMDATLRFIDSIEGGNIAIIQELYNCFVQTHKSANRVKKT